MKHTGLSVVPPVYIPNDDSPLSTQDIETISNSWNTASTPNSDEGKHLSPAAEIWARKQLLYYEDQYTTAKTLTCSITTFNVGCKGPPSDLRQIIKKEMNLSSNNNNNNDSVSSVGDSPNSSHGRKKNLADIIVIGLQEVDMSAAALWKEETVAAQPWITGIQQAIVSDTDAGHSHGGPQDGYCMLQSKQLVGMLILFFVRNHIKDSVKEYAVTSCATGAMGTLGNKGCVALRFRLHLSTFCFINAHLAAGQRNVAKRNEDINTILNQCDFNSTRFGGVFARDEDLLFDGDVSRKEDFLSSRKNNNNSEGLSGRLRTNSKYSGMQSPSVIRGNNTNTGESDTAVNITDYSTSVMDHSLVILLGDLNYRIDVSYEEGVARAANSDFAGLSKKDQLLAEMSHADSVFQGFTDHTPNMFPPTYRYDIGTNTYDTSEKKRIPAWTDRVLHWSRDASHSGVVREHMEVRQHVTCSDHKPVIAQFSLPYRQIVEEQRDKVLRDLREKVITHGVDKVSAAKISISETKLDFGTQTYYTPRKHHLVTFKNEGECVASVRTTRTSSNSDISGGKWLRCRPLNFHIRAGESKVVRIECILDVYSLEWMKQCHPFGGFGSGVKDGDAGDIAINSMLIFVVDNGPLNVLECALKVKPSVICNSIENILMLGNYVCADGYKMKSKEGVIVYKAPNSPPPKTGSSSSCESNMTQPYHSPTDKIRDQNLSKYLPKIPKEIWYLCDALVKRGATAKELFTADCPMTGVAAIMNHLDTVGGCIPPDVVISVEWNGEDEYQGMSISDISAALCKGSSSSSAQTPISISSADKEQYSNMCKTLTAQCIAACLLEFLKNLINPVIPREYYMSAINSVRSGGKVPLFFVHEQLPVANCNLFLYIIGFLRHLLKPQYAVQNELSAGTLSHIFARVLLSRPASVGESEGKSLAERRAIIHQHQLDAVNFLFYFLSPQQQMV